MINLKTLNNLLEINRENYSDYIHKRKFIYANKIKIVNMKILVLINKIDVDKLPKNLNYQMRKLETHIIEWINAWNMHKKLIKPSPKDEFVFSGYKKFPREIDKIIKKYLEDYKK